MEVLVQNCGRAFSSIHLSELLSPWPLGSVLPLELLTLATDGHITSSNVKLFIMSEEPKNVEGGCSSRLVQEHCVAKAGNSLGFSCLCSNFWNTEPGRSQCQPCLHHYLTHTEDHLPFPTASQMPSTLTHNPCQPWHLHTRSCDWPQWSWSLMQKGKYSLHLTYLRVKMKQARTGEKPCCYQCDIVEAHDHNPILACDRDPTGSAGGRWDLGGDLCLAHRAASTCCVAQAHLCSNTGIWDFERSPGLLLCPLPCGKCLEEALWGSSTP